MAQGDCRVDGLPSWSRLIEGKCMGPGLREADEALMRRDGGKIGTARVSQGTTANERPDDAPGPTAPADRAGDTEQPKCPTRIGELKLSGEVQALMDAPGLPWLSRSETEVRSCCLGATRVVWPKGPAGIKG
ncbi:hypothetical protein NDU88_004464 [Pleurodeles waltl]|uniref:Uncharacterized protein n=1 Tax=Pleurodeles waltl TaxID=8319 RepID=A0AAV7PCK5_PLEWA|nr:hypothetical protein NDU88_004464 [Pleurodeles waltl]